MQGVREMYKIKEKQGDNNMRQQKQFLHKK